MNSRNPVFFLGYGEALTCALARVDRLPLYDIYEPKPQKSRRIFKFLQFRTKRTTFRGDSRKFDIFRHRAQITPLRYIRIKITNITQKFYFFTRQNKKGYLSGLIEKIQHFSLVPRPPMNIFFIGTTSTNEHFFIGTTSTNDDIFHWSDLTMSVVKNDQ